MDRPWGDAPGVVVGPRWKRPDLLVFGKGQGMVAHERYPWRAMLACRATAVVLLLLAFVVPLAAGCGGDDAASGATSREPVEILVAASPTLTEVFAAIADDFTALHPDVSVTYNFVNAETIASQLKQGAEVDVFASPDIAHMEMVADLTAEPAVFARNTLTIVVENGNPMGIHSLSDLARDDLIVVLGAEGRPIGEYARRILRRQHITVKPASLEESARAVLTKVELGEADAGIVMVTDTVAAHGEVDDVPIPTDENTLATYPIAALKDAPHPAEAQAFVDYVLSADGQATLERFGFLPAAED